jgi:integrase
MPTRAQYIEAATRDNTRRSYRAALRHYEEEWGGLLPATADSISRYLTDHADTLSVNTLKQRLAALAKWHNEQGFPDPTKAPLVKTILKGIRRLHPAVEKQAKPLQLEQLEIVDTWLRHQAENSESDAVTQLRCIRDRALLLLGFWRGFRSDELCRLRVDHVTLTPGEGLTLYLPTSKGDRHNQGRTFRAPALCALCPVEAVNAWLTLIGRTEGPLFSRIDRWGRLSETPMNPGSINKWLRELFAKAGVPKSEQYSSHSLRRGFAGWANANQWDVKTLMQYVGWRDVQSALRYIDGADPFAAFRATTSSIGILHTDLEK